MQRCCYSFHYPHTAYIETSCRGIGDSCVFASHGSFLGTLCCLQKAYTTCERPPTLLYTITEYSGIEGTENAKPQAQCCKQQHVKIVSVHC